ncbi:MAG: hypothetical protein IH830_00715 [Planctomycetes bacterium]|nr:hypothetical protein [Planctomycetota bacterium]
MADLWSTERGPKPATIEPLALRMGAQQLSHGENYVSPHESADGYVPQDHLGIDRVYYHPTHRGYEACIRKRLEDLRARPKQPHENSTALHPHHD